MPWIFLITGLVVFIVASVLALIRDNFTWFIGALVGLVLIIAGAIIGLNQQADACADKGGHLYRAGRATLCVSVDGRIIE